MRRTFLALSLILACALPAGAQTPLPEPVTMLAPLASMPTQDSVGRRSYALKLNAIETPPAVSERVKFSIGDGVLVDGIVSRVQLNYYAATATAPKSHRVVIETEQGERNLAVAKVIRNWSNWATWTPLPADSPIRVLNSFQDATVRSTQKVWETPEGVALQLTVAITSTGDCLYIVVQGDRPPALTMAPQAACAPITSSPQ